METQETTADRVKKKMVEALDLDVGSDQLDDGMSLYTSVVQLDSMNLLGLIVALEEEFGGQLDDEDVMDADLGTVGDIVGLVDERLKN